MASFTNQATLLYNNTRTSSNIVQGEIVGVLSASKTALSAEYRAGDTISYVVNIVNSRSNDFTSLTLRDNLGAYAFNSGTLVPLEYVDGSLKYYVNGTLQDAPAVSSDAALTVSDFSVPAGGNALLIYSARTNSYAPLGEGGQISNIADISGSGLVTALSAQAQTAAANDVQLTLSKALSPATVTENGLLTYTIAIYNYGSRAVTAADGVVISDSFDPILSIASVSFNASPWTSANYSYNAANGLFTSNSGEITVPAASFTQNTATGEWNVTPGVSTLVISGTV